jgi:hypothetical protein
MARYDDAAAEGMGYDYLESKRGFEREAVVFKVCINPEYAVEINSRSCR